MLTQAPLSRLFDIGTAQVLDALLNVDGLTVRQAARVSGVSPSTASAAFARLRDRGLVRSVPVGSAMQFWINPEHFAVPHLRAMVEAARAAEESFPQLLTSALGSAPRSVILFGSTARGEATADSDIDLLVLAHDQAQLDAWEEHIGDPSQWLTERLGGPFQVILNLPPTATMLKRPFWRDVLAHGRLIYGERLQAHGEGGAGQGSRAKSRPVGARPGKTHAPRSKGS